MLLYILSMEMQYFIQPTRASNRGIESNALKTFQINVPYYFVDLPSPYESRTCFFLYNMHVFFYIDLFCLIIQIT